MPLLDANDALMGSDWSGFDQIVVGAGAAGIFLACSLAKRGKTVLLLESGDLEPNDARQALNRIEEIGKPLSDAAWSRKRVVGGTTTAWGGQSGLFPPEEFTERDWIAHSGWPIGFADLKPYYDQANLFMGVDTLNHDSDLHGPLRNKPPAFDPAIGYYHYSKWAREPNLFKLHRQALEASVTLLFNAHLLRIDLDEANAVRHIEVGNFKDERRTIPVSGELVLTTGGLESNRILLLNNHQHKDGLGGQSGWLGRCFMEHPCLEAGNVETRDMHRLQAAFGTHLYKGSRYGGRITTSPAWQAKHKRLSVASGFMWFYEGGDAGPLTSLKQVLRRPSPAALAKALAGLGELIPGLWALATEGLVYKPGAAARLVFSIEQAPDRDSRIDLSDQLDAFGQPLARLDWRIGRDSWDAMIDFAAALKSELHRLNLGEVHLFDHVRADTPDWEDYLSSVNHHMGGARMSEKAEDGVVDRNLQVWGVNGLYVCSAAVFPTGFHSNPTMTVLALGARLADRLTA